MTQDAVETAADSASVEVAEELLKYFVAVGAKVRIIIHLQESEIIDDVAQELFAATLYVCFDHVRPDIVAELSWRHGGSPFVFN